MPWLLLSIAAGGVVGVTCFFAVRFARRSPHNFAVPLSFALPPICWFAIFAGAFWLATLAVTCNAPDCGPLEFVAIGMFATAASTGGTIGAVVGVIWAWRRKVR